MPPKMELMFEVVDQSLIHKAVAEGPLSCMFFSDRPLATSFGPSVAG